MSPQRFMVATDLSLRDFDDVETGRALVGRVIEEIRELRRHDPRVTKVRVKVRSGRDEHVEVSLVIEAGSPGDAYEIGAGVMRTSIHAAGGSTVGWERICPQVLRVSSSSPRTRRRGRAVVDDRDDERSRPIPTWSEATATADRRVAAVGPLPPFAAPPFERHLIDLR